VDLKTLTLIEDPAEEEPNAEEGNVEEEFERILRESGE
jgi:hypothetical protein